MISQESKQTILDTVRIEDIVGDFVDLKKRGSGMSGLCPFHKEKTPSFHVSPTRNIYKCFGCGEGGDAVNFLMSLQQMSFPEALKAIAQKYNIAIEETQPSPEELHQNQLNESLYLVNQFAQTFYQDQLHNTDLGKSVGLQYFISRGFTLETILHWGLGITPPSIDQFTTKAIKQGYLKEHLNTLGLTNKYNSDFFRQRVLFPIHNTSGKIIAFAGRTLSHDKKIPKYINSPETPIYVKNKTLYGLYQAKQSIRKQDLCLIVEGYTDTIALHQAGISNTVATSGTALTSGQINLIKRHTPNITMLFDGDAAGTQAALRGLDILLEHDMNVRVLTLPSNHDPDSYLKEVGSEQFKNHINNQSFDFISFKTDGLLKDAQGQAQAHAKAISTILNTIALIPDTIKRSLYTKEIAQKVDLPSELLKNQLDAILDANAQKLKIKNSSQKQIQSSYATKKTSSNSIIRKKPTEIVHPYQEKDIARILICAGHLSFDGDEAESVTEYILEELKDIIPHFENQTYVRICELAQNAFKSGKIHTHEFYLDSEDIEIANFAKSCISPHYGEYSKNWWEKKEISLNTQKPYKENFTQDSIQSVRIFKLRKLVEMCHLNQQRLKDVDQNDIKQITTILQVQNKLNKMREEIAKQTQMIVLNGIG